MPEIENLLKQAVGELDKLLQARNVAGEPIEHGDVTLIPLVSYGFGFGAGGGNDQKSGGTGGGTGGGGGIKPMAVVVIDAQGARVESLKGAGSRIGEALGALAGKMAEGASKGRRGSEPVSED